MSVQASARNGVIEAVRDDPADPVAEERGQEDEHAE